LIVYLPFPQHPAIDRGREDTTGNSDVIGSDGLPKGIGLSRAESQQHVRPFQHIPNTQFDRFETMPIDSDHPALRVDDQQHRDVRNLLLVDLELNEPGIIVR